MLGNDIQRKMLEKIDIGSNEEFLGLARALAALEENRRKALVALLQELDVDVDLVDRADREERVDELVALAEARIAGDPWTYWVEWQAPEDLENVDRAQDYAGLEADEWEERLAKFAGVYREQFDDVDDLTDRQLAGHHIRSRFGLDLEEFEATVVAWTPARTMERAVAGPMQDMTAAVLDATAALQEEADDEV